MKGMIVVTPERCMGCSGCEVACAIEHSQSKRLVDAIHERPAPCSRVMVEQGRTFAVPLQCRQCEDAPCVAVCPTQALFRHDTDSPVVLDKDLCIGCKNCVLACPFGVIRMDERSHAIIKCDQCFERLQRHELPACVEACPIGALEFRTLDSAVTAKREAYLVQIEREGGSED